MGVTLGWALLFLLLAPSDRFVHSARYRVRVEAPAAFTLVGQTAYPSIVATMVHRDGARITLSAERVHKPKETSGDLAARSRRALEQKGMRIDRTGPIAGDSGAFALEAATRDGRQRIRQLYVVRPDTGFGYVLTLTAPAAKMETYARDFEEAWRSLEFVEDQE